MRYGTRVDSNHAEIREAARLAGYVWVDTYRQGDGVPDAFCLSRSGHWVALEIKSPGGRLTRAEREFWDSLPESAPAEIIYGIDQFYEVMYGYDNGNIR